MANECPDCGEKSGDLHEFFCTKERCPFCGGQLVTCGCIATILKLDDEERELIESYKDGYRLDLIVQGWKDALTEKGRLPVI